MHSIECWDYYIVDWPYVPDERAAEKVPRPRIESELNDWGESVVFTTWPIVEKTSISEADQAAIRIQITVFLTSRPHYVLRGVGIYEACRNGLVDERNFVKPF